MAKGNFIEYVVSDNPNKYPNGGEQGGYYYELYGEPPVKITHAGTIDDPIPAVAGMEYVYGKYYIEGETIYICKRTGEAEGGTIVLQFLPSALVGQYFEVVE